MIHSKAAHRPAIHMIDCEADALTSLALGAEKRLPDVSALLLREIGRANIYDAGRIPADVVTMMSNVVFTDEARNSELSFQLVYPREADISAGKISILTLIGAGLIGMRAGQAIIWPGRSGAERVLRICGVDRS